MKNDFVIADDSVIYLDGNSLGRLPKSVMPAVTNRIMEEWGGELIEAWEHWLDLPYRIGDLLATHLLGAPSGTVLMADSTSINFYKLVTAALDARPRRGTIISNEANFPTDRYIIEGLAETRKLSIEWIDTDPISGFSTDEVVERVNADTALIALSHVDYRNAAIADMRKINDIGHSHGALNLWDLSHSVGAIPITLEAAGTDLAVGCTYKYLNSGPGSPAFLYVNKKLQEHLTQPIWGWFGQTDQFSVDGPYLPKSGIGRFSVGTPSVVALAATQAGIESVIQEGIGNLRKKSIMLTEYLIQQAQADLLPLGFRVSSPLDSKCRGGHVLLTHDDAEKISFAMRIYARVIGDFRPPNGIRLTPAPAYIELADIDDAIERIVAIVRAGQYKSLDCSKQRVT